MAVHEDFSQVFEKRFHAHRKQSCSQSHSLSFDKATLNIILQTQDGNQSYNSDGSENFPAMLDSGYVLSKNWAFRGDDVMVATLSQEDGESYKYILLFCDELRKRLIGMTQVVYRSRNSVAYVEVFGCQMSRDRKVLGYVAGVLGRSDMHYMDCATEVVFYDTLLWLPIQTFHGPSGIPPTFSFNPQFKRSRVALLGLEHAPLIQVLCLNSGSVLVSRSVDFYDADGETTIQLLYTDDGSALIVQVTEYLGRGLDFLYRTYVLDADSLQVRHLTDSVLAATCHPGCQPLTKPLFSPGSRKMALLAKDSNGVLGVKVYSLRLLSTLKVLCRQILLDSGLSQTDIDILSLSDDLKAFLSLKPSHP